MTFAMIRGRVWRKRRKRRFAEEVDTSAAAARSTSSTAASCAPISLRPEGRTCVAAGGAMSCRLAGVRVRCVLRRPRTVQTRARLGRAASARLTGVQGTTRSKFTLLDLAIKKLDKKSQ
jgi:hypothetical protein